MDSRVSPKWSRSEAIEIVKRVLNGSGVWSGSYPEKLRGKMFGKMIGQDGKLEDHYAEWALAMECGVIWGLMHAYNITLQDLGHPEEHGAGLLDWETGDPLCLTNDGSSSSSLT